MFSIQQRDAELNQMILSGQALEAFDRYYAEGVVMQENSDAPTIGKAENRAREVAYFGQIEAFHGASVDATAVTGDTSFSQWTTDITFKPGVRVKGTQVAKRTWKDGQIVEERFFYSK